MATITEITEQHRASFGEQGFVVIPGVLDDARLASGRELAAALLAVEPPGAELTGPYFLWPRFGPAGHPLLDFYRESGIERLAAGLLRPDLAVREPDFAQLATTIPPWPHRPGGPHVDGLPPKPPDGRPGTFSLLAGIWLTDQSRPHQGNLWTWPGTHLRFGAYLAERGADALGRVEEMGPGPPITCSRTTSAGTTVRRRPGRGRRSTTDSRRTGTGSAGARRSPARSWTTPSAVAVAVAAAATQLGRCHKVATK